MRTKVLPKVPLQTSFEVRPWASHPLKSRRANVALPAMATFALADLLSRRGFGASMRATRRVGRNAEAT